MEDITPKTQPDQHKEEFVRRPSPETFVKSFSSSDENHPDRSSPKYDNTFNSTSAAPSLSIVSDYSRSPAQCYSSKETLAETSPISDVSPVSPVSTNLEKYFPSFSSTDISEEMLPCSCSPCPSPTSYSGPQSVFSVDLNHVRTQEKQTTVNYSHDKAKSSDNSAKSSESSQQKDCEQFEKNCMKFAEVLYKCTLCTTLPSILTSKQSFLTHVSKQHLNEDASEYSCKQCVLNFCTEEDLKSHKTTYHSHMGKGPLSLSDLSDDSDSSDINSVPMYTKSSNVMWCGEKDTNKKKSCKPFNNENVLKPFGNSQESVSLRGNNTVASGSPKGQKPLELRRGIMHSGHPSRYVQTKHVTCNSIHSNDKTCPDTNNYSLKGMVEIEKMKNQMYQPQSHNFATMATVGTNLNSYTPEFGKYTKLVREGGNIVYFCQVCNWKCPVKSIFQTHCRGIQHQSKVISADDSSGNSSNSPGPASATDNESNKNLQKRDNERKTMNLNENSSTMMHQRNTEHPEADKITTSLGNKSPLRSLLASTHVPRSASSIVERNSHSKNHITYGSVDNTYQRCYDVANNAQTGVLGTVETQGRFAVASYEYSQGYFPFCVAPGGIHSPRFMSRTPISGNNTSLSSSRNRRKRPAPVALRNQFTDSDSDSESDQQKKDKKDTACIGTVGNTKNGVSVIHSPNKHNATTTSGSDIARNRHFINTKMHSSDAELVMHQTSSYHDRGNLLSRSATAHDVQPCDLSTKSNHIGDDHASTNPESLNTPVQIKQEHPEGESHAKFTCSHCGYSTVFVDAYRTHMAKEHGIDSVNVGHVWRPSGMGPPVKSDYLIGEHDDSVTDRSNVNSEGWKIVKIKGALPDIVQASPRGNVSRDILLQKISVAVNLPDVVQWGPACNKAVREIFPASLAQRKGKYKKTYFFGLEYVDQLAQLDDDSSDAENAGYQSLRDMSRDLDLIVRFLPDILHWTGDMESGTSRDQVLTVLAAKIRDPDAYHWGIQCNRAARLLFPDIQMRRKGKYKSVFYGVEFLKSLQKEDLNPLKLGRSLDLLSKNSFNSELADLTATDTKNNTNSSQSVSHFEPNPRYQHYWHSSENVQETNSTLSTANTGDTNIQASSLPHLEEPTSSTNQDTVTSQMNTEEATRDIDQFPQNTHIPDSDSNITSVQCSPKNEASSSLTDDESLRDI